MRKKILLNRLLAGLFLLVLFGCIDGLISEQPNILLIIIDDLRPELGCYGNDHMMTPNIDKLAAGGTVFDNSYCNVPVCMPSRVSLLTSLRTDRTMGRTKKLGREFITLPKYLKDHGYITISNGKVFHHIDDRAEDWSDPPWRPHLPFNAPKKYWDLYDPEKLPLADNRFIPENLPDLCQNSPEMYEYAGIDGFPDGETFHRKALHGYYACVSYVDALVGRLLDALKANNLDENTIVVLIGDHGWHLGEHNFWGKHNTLKNALHSPLIVRTPGYPESNHSPALVEYLDVYPTLVQLAGLPLPDHVEGRSLAPLLENPDLPWKDALYFFWNDKQKDKGKLDRVDAVAVKTAQFLYTEWHQENKVIDRMLFDHQSDPQENVNIAGDPGRQNVVKDLSKRIKNFMALSFFKRGTKILPGVTTQEHRTK
jgi:arylsulfatase A-like enzyme